MAHQIDVPDRLLSDVDVSGLSGISTKTLANWRSMGIGPHFLKLGAGKKGAIRYRLSDINRWLDDCARTNTAGGRPDRGRQP